MTLSPLQDLGFLAVIVTTVVFVARKLYRWWTGQSERDYEEGERA